MTLTPVRNLEPREIESPLTVARWMEDDTRVLVDPHARVTGEGDRLEPAATDEQGRPPSLERAGPRRRLHFDPRRTKAAILTAGGLSPGLNDVIRGIVHELTYQYGVGDVLGLRYGYDGLRREPPEAPTKLTPDSVASCHGRGGSLLGTARGSHDTEELADTVEHLGLHLLFCIGGDGTLKGALRLDEELERRGRDVAIVGIPKTIDNDVGLCTRTFGFMTAVEEATRAISAAHSEARSHVRGIGLVKLMGRHAGFIAAAATLACPDVNVCLVPEVPFRLEGPGGLLAWLEHRLEARRHAVIVVAEGAGAELLADRARRDASGNVRPADIGTHLAEAIPAGLSRSVTLKYIDPSYGIRGRGANATDKIFCGHLAKMAVHAAMAGKTRLMVSEWHGLFVHVGLADAILEPKRLKPEGLLWQSVLATTGQPPLA